MNFGQKCSPGECLHCFSVGVKKRICNVFGKHGCSEKQKKQVELKHFECTVCVLVTSMGLSMENKMYKDVELEKVSPFLLSYSTCRYM